MVILTLCVKVKLWLKIGLGGSISVPYHLADDRVGWIGGLTETTNMSRTMTTTLQPPSEQWLWLSLYFLSNLILTLYNKLVLVQFPFPYSLTAIHALCGVIGGIVLLERGTYDPKRMEAKENAVLLLFGLVYALNIAVSNVSLGLVTVPVSDDVCYSK